jgi:preprotein translocase subunit SecE
MEKVKQTVAGARTFLSEVGQEMRRTTWPARKELVDSTVVVIVSVVLMSLFVGLCDRVLMLVLQVLVPSR